MVSGSYREVMIEALAAGLLQQHPGEVNAAVLDFLRASTAP